MSQLERVTLPLILNQVPKGDALILLRERDVLVEVSELHAAGLVEFSGRREKIEGEEFVSLTSLRPGLSFDLDERDLVLRVTAAPALLGRTAVDLRPGHPPDLEYASDLSGFVNYALRWPDLTRDPAMTAAFGELGAGSGGKLVFTSFSRNASGELARGLSNFTYDDRQRLTRWVGGDRFFPSDDLGGGVLVGGLSVAREFSLDPYFSRFPGVDLTGEVLTPSTADVYVNGLLVRREELEPGRFQLRNLPVPAGTGVARVVIRDAFGRERDLESSFYLSTSILAPGVHDYSYSVGFPRNDAGGKGAGDYGKAAFLGRHRLGLTQWLTAGLRAELSSDLENGGPIIAARLPVGDVEASAAISSERGATGMAGSLAYNYLGRRASFGVAARTLGDRYATLGLRQQEDRARFEATAFGGLPLTSALSLIAGFTNARFRDRGLVRTASLSVGIRLGDHANLFVLASRMLAGEDGPATNVFAGLSYYFANNSVASISYERQSSGDSRSLELQRSLPIGTGYGYRLRAVDREGQRSFPEELQYQGPYGRYEVSYERTNGSGVAEASIAGGALALGRSVHPTRPLSDSFALVRVPNVEGVRTYVENQEVGRTNARGELAIPSLLPYYGNRISIDDRDVPLDHTIAASQKTIAPPYRGGAVVTFPVETTRALIGRVVAERSGKTLVPAYGTLSFTAAGKRFESPIGRDGEFYLENVPAGKHFARVTSKNVACGLWVASPASGSGQIDVGTLRCAASSGGAR